MNGRIRSRSLAVSTSPGLKSGLAFAFPVSHCSTVALVGRVSSAATVAALQATRKSATVSVRTTHRRNASAHTNLVDRELTLLIHNSLITEAFSFQTSRSKQSTPFR